MAKKATEQINTDSKFYVVLPDGRHGIGMQAEGDLVEVQLGPSGPYQCFKLKELRLIEEEEFYTWLYGKQN